MPGGVVFLVCIPTLNYEHELVFGVPIPQKRTRRAENKLQRPVANVDLRLKEVKSKAELLTLDDEQQDIDVTGQYRTQQLNAPASRPKPNDPVFISMETVCIYLHLIIGNICISFVFFVIFFCFLCRCWVNF